MLDSTIYEIAKLDYSLPLGESHRFAKSQKRYIFYNNNRSNCTHLPLIWSGDICDIYDTKQLSGSINLH